MKSPAHAGFFLMFFVNYGIIYTMQYKYIVFYPRGQRQLVVDIWSTTGELTHPVYIQKHGLDEQDISSMGYFVYNPSRQKWSLEHVQFGEPANTIADLIGRCRQINRDKNLVYRAWEQTSFPNDPAVQKATFEDYKLYQKTKAEDRKAFIRKLIRSLCHTRG